MLAVGFFQLTFDFMKFGYRLLSCWDITEKNIAFHDRSAHPVLITLHDWCSQAYCIDHHNRRQNDGATSSVFRQRVMPGDSCKGYVRRVMPNLSIYLMNAKGT